MLQCASILTDLSEPTSIRYMAADMKVCGRQLPKSCISSHDRGYYESLSCRGVFGRLAHSCVARISSVAVMSASRPYWGVMLYFTSNGKWSITTNSCGYHLWRFKCVVTCTIGSTAHSVLSPNATWTVMPERSSRRPCCVDG